ncbi:MAG: metallophosphoesterase [Bacteroidota bacterium]
MLRYRIMIALVFGLFFLLVDWYFFQAITSVSRDWNPLPQRLFRWGYWVPSVLSVAAMLWWTFDDPFRYSATFRNWVITALFATYFSKLAGVLVLMAGDLVRGIRWVVAMVSPGQPAAGEGPVMSRSEFLSTAAVAAAAVPLGTFAFGIMSGAHDYRLRRQKVIIPGLPSSLDGITIGQISDIHSGSFWNKTAVEGGVDLLLQQKPDLITFTGDLVNNETAEVRDYVPVFSKLKAPLGVYSVTGNHDYGDYRPWSTKAAKQKNFEDLIEAHRLLGFRLLMNEHEVLTVNGEPLIIAGVENWGAGRFAKYGKLDQALKNANDGAMRILLSHDPSHWDAQVRNHEVKAELTLAGHTHGFQFGVEVGGVKWSPSQYLYKQWAGLYREGDHQLYVNRGFGYLGYPGRVGMPPELTILELVRA